MATLPPPSSPPTPRSKRLAYLKSPAGVARALVATILSLISPGVSPDHGHARADDLPTISSAQEQQTSPPAHSDREVSPPDGPTFIHEEDLLNPSGQMDAAHEDALNDEDLATDASYTDHTMASLFADPADQPSFPSSTPPLAAGLWLGESHYDPLGVFFSHQLPLAATNSPRSWLVYGLGYDGDFVEIERSDLALDLSEHSIFTKLQFLYYPVKSSPWWFVSATGYLSYSHVTLHDIHLYRENYQRKMQQLSILGGGFQVGMGLHKSFSRWFKQSPHPQMNPSQPRYFFQLHLSPLTLHNTLFMWGDDTLDDGVLDFYFDLTAPTSKLISPLHFHINYAFVFGYYL